MVVKRVGVWSVARMAAAIYATIGLIGGLFLAFFSVVGLGFASSNMHDGDVPQWLGSMLGMAAIVAFPILYGVLGFIGGALTAAIYNLYSGMVGGVELDVQSS
jgi:hypothetical protein